MSLRTGSLGLVIAVNSSNSRHSEKTENLASSVDFRLIQNLLMLIIFMMSGFPARPTLFHFSLITLQQTKQCSKKIPSGDSPKCSINF